MAFSKPPRLWPNGMLPSNVILLKVVSCMSLGQRKGGWAVGGWSVECGGESVEGKREHRRVYTHSTLSSLCPAGSVSGQW